MKNILATLAILLIASIAIAQTGKQTPDSSLDGLFTKWEVPAQFPGGPDGWRTYLKKNLIYPDQAQKKKIQGVARVKFIVDVEGNISEIQVVNDPGGGLADEAVRLIKEGPKWVPAEQNGKKVNYKHIQSITFKLE